MAEIPAGWQVLEVDLHGVVDKEGLLDRLAAAGRFPAWFGRNWDALEELLADLSWLEAPTGWLLVLEGEDDARLRLPGDLAVLDEILDAVAERWASRGTPFVVTAGGSATDR